MAEMFALAAPRFHRTGVLVDRWLTRTTHGPWAQFDLRTTGGRRLRGSAFDAQAEAVHASAANRPVTLVGYTRQRTVIAPDGALVPAERFLVLRVLEPLHENLARADWLALERERGLPDDAPDHAMALNALYA